MTSDSGGSRVTALGVLTATRTTICTWTAAGRFTLRPMVAPKRGILTRLHPVGTCGVSNSQSTAMVCFSGAPAAAYDTNLYRSAANVLKTDDEFHARVRSVSSARATVPCRWVLLLGLALCRTGVLAGPISEDWRVRHWWDIPHRYDVLPEHYPLSGWVTPQC